MTRYLLPLALVASITAAAFAPVLGNGFVNWDDPDVFLRNERLAQPGVIAWAFTTDHMGHYQPLSWVIWSGVRRLFGEAPAAFHALSLISHVANAALVYVLAWRLALVVGAAAPIVVAFCTSLLFAVHPLRVEPVAWASAFPYVLALALLLVSTVAYLEFATSARSRGAWYVAATIAYALSLLARPAALAFPVVLLALDVYPLRRWPAQPSKPGQRAYGIAGAPGLWSCLLEKVPFAILALATALAESSARAFTPLERVGLGARLSAAVVAPFTYLARTALPAGLTPLEPLPLEPQVSWSALLLGLAGIVALSAVVWRLRRAWPALGISWAAYLVLLLPALGLAPSGLQATADRYTYMPAVALAILIGAAAGRWWGGTEPGRAQPRRAPSAGNPARVAAALAAGAIALWLAVETAHQTLWWRDSITLWTRAAELDPQNDVALYNLAVALDDEGREDEAIARYEETLRLLPDHAPARHNLSLLQATRLQREADALAAAGRADEALARYDRVLAVDPARARARAARGVLLVRTGRLTDAIDDLRAALDAGVDDPEVANSLAFGLAQSGRGREAVAVLRAALARRADDLNLTHNLARLLATHPNPAVRDAREALRLALRARDATGGRDPRVLDTLAAAYVAAGQPELARRAWEQAAALAEAAGDRELAVEIRAREKKRM